MKLVDMSVAKYLEVLKSDESVTGGGAVSALALAQGLGLLLMVCNFTLGREKYADYEAICEKTKKDCEDLLGRAFELIDLDMEAYNSVIEAYKLPKETESQIEDRKKEIQKSLVKATEVPLEIMELSEKAIQLGKGLNGKSNSNLISDIAVASMNFYDSGRSAWLNVKINVPNIKDADLKEKLELRGKNYLENIERESNSLYDNILGTF